ncbi:MAG: flagellar hook-associated protein FlgL [Planctomycetaceae bacterium]|nr:flagellar hook-associated protein FlgL [Planctomycetaceae bacterium]
MDFRVTPSFTVAQFLTRLTQQNSRIANLNQQASSGLRISRPSDDPAGLRSLLRTEEAIGRLDTRISSITAARYRLEQASINVQDAHSLFVRAEVIASQAVQSLEPAEREILADELDGILRQLDALANVEISGEFLFAGIATNKLPFPGAGNSSNTSYQGAEIPRSLQLHSGGPTVVLGSGASIFQPISRGTTLYLGGTGAAAGIGTDNARGRGTLIVSHVETTFAPGSGITAGTGSAAGNTIIGPAGANKLTIVDTSGTGAFGTVSLNGGPPVAFTNGDTNLKLVGPLNEVVFVDTTAITAGFTGEIDLTATGTLSVDGGLSSVAIDFSTNQAVTNSATGAITNVDSTAIRQVGQEHLEYTGTADAFAVLRELRDDIRNVRDQDGGEQREAIARRLTDVQRVQNHFLNVLGEQSVTLTQLNDVQSNSEAARLDFQRHLSTVGAADISQVALDLTQARNQLQYTLATASQLFDLSLLDFIR